MVHWSGRRPRLHCLYGHIIGVREVLQPVLGLRLVNLQGYRPDFYADEAIWGWVREEATGNLCLGSKAKVQVWAHLSMRSHRISTTRATLELLLLVSITSLFTCFRAPKRPNKILPHSRAYFVPTATNKDPPCTPLAQSSIKFYPIPTPESFVKNGIARPKWPGRIFFPTSTPVDPLIRI